MLAIEPLYRLERERGRVKRRVLDGWQLLRFTYNQGLIERAVVGVHRRRWFARLRKFAMEYFGRY